MNSGWLTTVPGIVSRVLQVYSPAWEVYRLLKTSLLIRTSSLVGPVPVIVKFSPLIMTLPLGSSHCTARVDVGGRSGSLLVLQISV